MKFSIKTLLYLKNFSYFRIAKLAMKDSGKIVRDSVISKNSENPVIQKLAESAK